MEYTDDNMQLVAEKICENMSLDELQEYVAEDYFFRFEQDSEFFKDQVEFYGLDKESEVD
jgi:hypothetical protein